MQIICITQHYLNKLHNIRNVFIGFRFIFVNVYSIWRGIVFISEYVVSGIEIKQQKFTYILPI